MRQKKPTTIGELIDSAWQLMLAETEDEETVVQRYVHRCYHSSMGTQSCESEQSEQKSEKISLERHYDEETREDETEPREDEIEPKEDETEPPSVKEKSLTNRKVVHFSPQGEEYSGFYHLLPKRWTEQQQSQAKREEPIDIPSTITVVNEDKADNHSSDIEGNVARLLKIEEEDSNSSRKNNSSKQGKVNARKKERGPRNSLPRASDSKSKHRSPISNGERSWQDGYQSGRTRTKHDRPSRRHSRNTGSTLR